MPPKKKGSGKKGKKGKKKVSTDGGGFMEILNEVLYLAPQERWRREQHATELIHSLIRTFEFERGSRICDTREIGTMFCALGFNPTARQLNAFTERVLHRSAVLEAAAAAAKDAPCLVAGLIGVSEQSVSASPAITIDMSAPPERFDGQAFLEIALPILLTHEMSFDIIVPPAPDAPEVPPGSSGVPVVTAPTTTPPAKGSKKGKKTKKSSKKKSASKSKAPPPPPQEIDLVPRHTEDELLRSFDCIWSQDGARKLDFDEQKCIEWESLREALRSNTMLGNGAPPVLDEMELEEMYNAAVDPESGYVREEYATVLALE